MDDRYYGLGEKSGDLERTGRIFDMRCLDALGYDAGSTDPPVQTRAFPHDPHRQRCLRDLL
ncbi:hypothetical protein [Cutibacterium acnes]|uniref:hypothetical protein n=1 Tax=Cutibacterium acnes TaxID=1747 RepID=UPI0032B84168